MSFHQKYLDVAKKACEAERRYDWEKAAFHWNLSVELAIGRNRGWAIARCEYCRSRLGIRPLIIRERY